MTELSSSLIGDALGRQRICPVPPRVAWCAITTPSADTRRGAARAGDSHTPRARVCTAFCSQTETGAHPIKIYFAASSALRANL